MNRELSQREQRALAVAREAWPSAVPTAADIESATQRLQARVPKRRRRMLPRQLGRLSVIFVVLGAGLAWAAGGGNAVEATLRPKAPAMLDETAGGAQALATRTLATTNGQATIDGDATTSDPIAAPLPTTVAPGAWQPSGGPSAALAESDAAKTASAWRRVRSALASGDSTGAERALSELSAHKDPQTQLKAELGMAQLALSQGDCQRATAISARILSKQSDGAMQKRARDIVIRCAAQ
jgi:hypothetical protein